MSSILRASANQTKTKLIDQKTSSNLLILAMNKSKITEPNNLRSMSKNPNADMVKCS